MVGCGVLWAHAQETTETFPRNEAGEHVSMALEQGLTEELMFSLEKPELAGQDSGNCFIHY